MGIQSHETGEAPDSDESSMLDSLLTAPPASKGAPGAVGPSLRLSELGDAR